MSARLAYSSLSAMFWRITEKIQKVSVERAEAVVYCPLTFERKIGRICNLDTVLLSSISHSLPSCTNPQREVEQTIVVARTVSCSLGTAVPV